MADYHVSGEGPTISGTATLNQSVGRRGDDRDGHGRRVHADARRACRTPRAARSPTSTSPDRRRVQDRGARQARVRQPRQRRRSTSPAACRERRPARAAADAPPVISTMTLDATGTLTDSAFLGGRLPQLRFDAHLEQDTLTGRADGRFEGFNPARLAGTQGARRQRHRHRRRELRHRRHQRADHARRRRRRTARVALDPSIVGGLQIDSADVEGRYAARSPTSTQLHVTGPDVKLDASGRLALDRDVGVEPEVPRRRDRPHRARRSWPVRPASTARRSSTARSPATRRRSQTTGTLDGSNLVVRREQGARSRTASTPSPCPTWSSRTRTSQATTRRDVRRGRRPADQRGDGDDDLRRRSASSSRRTSRRRRASSTRPASVIFHPRSPGDPPAAARGRTQGVEWRTAPGQRGDRQVRPRTASSSRTSGWRAAIRRSTVSGTLALEGRHSRRARSRCTRATSIIAQLETLLLQNRGFTGRLTADATISGRRPRRSSTGTSRSTTARSRPTSISRSSPTSTTRGTRIALDATLQQSPTESITAKGTRADDAVQASAGGEHVGRRAGRRRSICSIKSTALNLGVVQGFTTQSPTSPARSRPTCTSPAPARIRTSRASSTSRTARFGVPAFGGVVHRPRHPHRSRAGVGAHPAVRRSSTRTASSCASPASSPCTSARSARSTSRIDSDNFEVIDNELGDVGVETTLKVTGELRRPQARRRRAARRRPRSRSTGSCSCSTTRIASKRCPTSSRPSARPRARGSARRGDARRRWREPSQAAAPAGGHAGGSRRGAAPPSSAVRDRRARPPRADSRQPRAARQEAAARRADRRGARRHQHHRRRRPRRPQGPRARRSRSPGPSNTVRGTYQFQGRRFDLARDGTLRFTGDARAQPDRSTSPRRARFPTPASRRGSGSPARRRAPELALSSTPPLEESDILSLIVFNRPINELGTRRARVARGDRRRDRHRLHRHAARRVDRPGARSRSLRDHDDDRGRHAGRRHHASASRSATRRSSSCASSSASAAYSEFLLEYQLADFLRLQATAAPETIRRRPTASASAASSARGSI